MNYLNLGCGSRFHSEWINLDLKPVDRSIRLHDLRKGIPYDDNSFEVVYHSHVLEHLHKTQVPFFLKECWRVLKPKGIIRVAIPNLEGIVRNYAIALDKAMQGEREWENHYDWMMLELYDQAVREEPGGEMIRYLQQDPIPGQSFVSERIGIEAKSMVTRLRKQNPLPRRNSAKSPKRRRTLSQLFLTAKEQLLAQILAEEDYKALLLGRFRLGGEIHLWMYDRFSLSRLLIQASFNNPVEREPSESAIENWNEYNLDTEPDGTVYKPDSLYMEAVKP